MPLLKGKHNSTVRANRSVQDMQNECEQSYILLLQVPVPTLNCQTPEFKRAK